MEKVLSSHLSLLVSKITRPLLPPNHVSRSRLIEKLDNTFDQHTNIIFVLAPTGFGKTAFVNEWAGISNEAVAWFSIEEADDQPKLFWHYFARSIAQALSDKIPSEFSGSLEFTGSIIHSYLVGLINLLDQTNVSLSIILDDLHTIKSKEILKELFFFLDHLPDKVHFLITSRCSLDWSLTRMRAKGQVMEIYPSDLLMDEYEIKQLFKNVNKQVFSEGEINNLRLWTEGWVFGLSSVAELMQKTGEISKENCILQCAGDYFLEEILSDLEPDLIDFLLKISILDDFSPDLCEYITGRHDTGSLLEKLNERFLLFPSGKVQPDWYRIHLFLLMQLRDRLDQTNERIKSKLHILASDWFDKNGFISLAVDHALRCGDYSRAVQLLEKNLFSILDQDELRRQSELISRLPEDILHSKPDLLIAAAWLMAYAGDCKQSFTFLEDAEGILSKLEKNNRRRIEGKILAVQAYDYWLQGDNFNTIKKACQALINLPVEDALNRSVTLISLAGALEECGQLNESLEAFTEAITTSRKTNCTHMYIMACAGKVRLLVNLGRLHQADLFAESTIRQFSSRNNDKPVQNAAVGNLYAHRAEIHRFWNDLESALAFADEGVRLGEKWGQADTTITTKAVKISVLWSMNRRSEAEQMIEEVRQLARQVSPWYLSYLDGYHVLLGIGEVQNSENEKWLDLNVPIDECEFTHHDSLLCRSRIRLLCLNQKYEEALKWLNFVQEDAEKSGTRLVFADSLIMRAICMYQLDQEVEGLQIFIRALDIIQNEDAIRLVLDKGTLVNNLLIAMVRQGIQAQFASMILERIRILQDSENSTPDDVKSMTIAKQKIAGLSAREREILAYLITHKTSTEIANDLTVSANTVRFHIKSIYDKLDVHSRGEAVECAKRLRLI